MRSLITAAILAVAVVVAGCSNVNNPFSAPTLDKVETAYGAVLAVAMNYKRACANRVIPNSCRLIVPKLQEYDRKTHISIVAARNFVDNYPQLNPANAILAAQQAVTDFRNFQVSQGVN
jgi:hypothetical protein